jgi:hypothetical protein
MGNDLENRKYSRRLNIKTAAWNVSGMKNM